MPKNKQNKQQKQIKKTEYQSFEKTNKTKNKEKTKTIKKTRKNIPSEQRKPFKLVNYLAWHLTLCVLFVASGATVDVPFVPRIHQACQGY